MKKLIHIEINLLALGKSFSQSALAEISAANIGQDALKYQLGHDHYHYDNSSFSESDKYCESLRHETQDLIKQGDTAKARISFGKLTHTVQIFTPIPIMSICFGRLTRPLRRKRSTR